MSSVCFRQRNAAVSAGSERLAHRSIAEFTGAKLLATTARPASDDWGPKVSVFWTDRHFSLGRFPPLDRIDYLDHAVALVERECVRPARPTLEDIRHYLRGAPFATWADRARSFAAAEALEPKDHKAC